MLSQFNNLHKVTRFLSVFEKERDFVPRRIYQKPDAGGSFELAFLVAGFTSHILSTTSAILWNISSISPTPWMVESLSCFL